MTVKDKKITIGNVLGVSKLDENNRTYLPKSVREFLGVNGTGEENLIYAIDEEGNLIIAVSKIKKDG